jgi:pantothenate kinase
MPDAALQTDLGTLSAYLRQTQGPSRRLVAIAGAPGSGKSMFARRLSEDLNRVWRDISQVLPMDGYHFDDAVLIERGERARKGAPHTFDVGGFAVMLDRLRADDGSEIAIPVFDRSLEIARAGAEIVLPSTRIVLVEGNYLLLDDPAWAALRSRFDVSVWLDVPRLVLADRLVRRWSDLGLSSDEIRTKVEANDLPNADMVIAQSCPAAFSIRNF